MEKNIKVVLLVFIIIISGVFIFFYSFQSKFSLSPQLPQSPQLNDGKTEEQIMQALIDSTTAPTTTIPMSIEERKQIIDSTTAPALKTETIIF